MPKENKKRGRRMNDKKRKHDDDEQSPSKRQKADEQLQQELDDAVERPFFGLLDDEEQSFFHHADETLQADTFPSSEDKQAFLRSVFKEAEGKELKLANSQSCSRLLERLIKQSSAEQCRSLFAKFAGNFNHLMTHRFASHVCETLFEHAAPLMDKSLEEQFLSTLEEIRKDAGYLVTDPYASHGLRVLLTQMSGEKAPESFSKALQSFLAGVVSNTTTDQLRTLATHPHASPTLQTLLKLELSIGKGKAKEERSIIRLLLPDEPITAECDSVTFLNGMVYDPVGSHLVETIVQSAPGKLFKSLYKAMLCERIPSYARNEIASHISCRILERLSHNDLLDAHEALIPLVSDLLRRNRTNVVRTLIERCTVRSIDTQAIAVQVNNTWSTPEGFEIQKLLKTNLPVKQTVNEESQASLEEVSDQVLPPEEPVTPKVKAHFNLLAQAMLLVPGPLSALVLDALVSLDGESLIAMSYDPIVSRTLQAALTAKTSSIVTTRKLVQHFYGQIGNMAVDQSASHVVDCIWEGTHGLAFIRERIAEEIAENETKLRDSPIGRAVWRNWKMDIYKRKRGEWVRQSKIKASNDGFQSFSEIDSVKAGDGTPKTPLQLARERHARERKQKDSREKDPPLRTGPVAA